MNKLSIHRPRPFIETLMPASCKTVTKRGLVNWLPWSVLETYELRNLPRPARPKRSDPPPPDLPPRAPKSPKRDERIRPGGLLWSGGKPLAKRFRIRGMDAPRTGGTGLRKVRI
jgi:hypothetical protein